MRVADVRAGIPHQCRLGICRPNIGDAHRALLPPRPPSPPEGPPPGTNFSRRKAMQPLPPSPAFTRIFASSTNMGKQWLVASEKAVSRQPSGSRTCGTVGLVTLFPQRPLLAGLLERVREPVLNRYGRTIAQNLAPEGGEKS